MPKHNWQYKRVEMGWLVCCAECGREDGIYATEEDAKIQRLALINQIIPTYGLNRRIRKAKSK